MRNARSMFQLGRKALGVVLAGWVCCCGWGCHQHHYYYYGGQGPGGACPPGTVVPSTVAGPVCEIPSTVDGGTVVGSRTTTTIENGRKSRVVVSEPSGSSRSARYGWRSAEYDDAPAMTHVEGGLGDSVVK
jgi:hypothetical protein